MVASLPPHFIELVYDALLKSFWRKKSLKRFLRRCGIAETFLSQLDPDESKREWLDRLFPKLEIADHAAAVIQQMARFLADQTSFPDLETWEDSAEKIEVARSAVDALGAYIAQNEQRKEDATAARERREQAEERRITSIRSQHDLERLKERLDSLAVKIGTQDGGYAFQDWFYDVAEYSDIDHHCPYNDKGRQIDGSITLDGTTYLVELKFTRNQTGAPDVDSLLAKVNAKSDNTMGVMFSMSGYSSVAIRTASFPKSPILLFDHSHLYMVLTGVASLADVILRVRRHSSQRGNAYLSVQDFGT